MQPLNYSKLIKSILSRKKLHIGDRIRVIKGKKYVYEGLLMPRPEVGDRDCIILKLDNGYNVGIRYEKGMVVQKGATAEPKAVEKEAAIELGKIKEQFLKHYSFNPLKPKVSIIATGGTIASRVDYRTGGVYMLMKPEEFLFNIPELRDFVNITSISNPFNKASEDLSPHDWKEIARLCESKINSGEGVIITHGTDTLHFTAAVLSFMLRKKGEKWNMSHTLSKPVVLTGAQRSSDRGSTDAYMNLICSSIVAGSDIAHVGICMHATQNDDYCYFMLGTRVRKMHTTRRDAFKAIGIQPLAKIWPDGKIESRAGYNKTTDEKIVADTNFEEKVALIKVYPGSEPKMLRFFQKERYRGIVIEGTGMGHVPTLCKRSWIENIRKISDDVVVTIAPQTLYGRLNKYVYSNLRILSNAGAIILEDMLPETAYVKLGWVLGHTKNLQKIKETMLTNIAGEITERSIIC